MDVLNDTPLQHGFAFGLGPDRQPCISIVLKATFTIPEGSGEPVSLAEEQLPITTAETYYDGNDKGSIRTESDAVPFKPRADVVLAGTAYAPQGRPATSVDVALRVGATRKVIRVFGDRQWLFPSRLVMVPVKSDPEPFQTMPLIYERAFGGFDRTAGSFCHQNHIGRGYIGEKDKDSVNEVYLPNLEDPADPIDSWDDEPTPAGFGCISPSWEPRAGFAGTEEGMEQPHPLLGVAADFELDFFNSAHPDLQVPGYLNGDEEVELMNVTPDGYRSFRLPGLAPTVQLGMYDETPRFDELDVLMEEHPTRTLEELLPAVQEVTVPSVLDTLVFLPDDGVFYQVWRAPYPVDEVQTEDDIETIFLKLARLEIHTEAR
ncbi:MAG: DUF2169 domain-containing protein [Bacteroidetes bacterium]|jgi:hypothetical protein|nr:DUF2169 domain-containing protein [Bacteroidota bacterium]